jgi:hypothetical protein
MAITSIQLVAPSGELYTSDSLYSTSSSTASIVLRYLADENGYEPYNANTGLGDYLTIEHDGVTYVLSDGDIAIDEDTITFPNPDVYPEGVFLVEGLNAFVLRCSNGSDSFVFRWNIVYTTTSLLESPQPPQGLSVNRLSDSIEVVFVHEDPTVTYYAVYASTTSGGGVTGYTKINYRPVDPLSYGYFEETVTPIVSSITDETNGLSDTPASIYFIQGEESTDPQTLQVYNDILPDNLNRLRITASIDSVTLTQYVKFRHYRTGNNRTNPPTVQIGSFAALPNDQPLFYVVKAFRVVNGVEVESGFSAEVSGLPIFIPNTLATIPQVSRNKLLENTIATVYRAQPDLSVQPGSVVRDVFIDPVVSEMERLRFILDFTYRASSFPTLIQIDDPRGIGVSSSVANSPYKQALKNALFLITDDEVQTLIDSSFDRLAANFGVTRSNGTYASGEVVFYTKRAPTYSLIIPTGTTVYSGSVGFITTQYAEIPLAEIATYYDPTNTRYAITVPVRAVTLGSAGNVTTNQITRGAPIGLLVTNESPTFGGKDSESNQSLAARAFSAIASIDKGTRAGYERISRSLPGVEASFVVDAGSPYMIRDNSLGGKVDIWVRGNSIATISDVVAPVYTVHRGSLFLQIDGSSSYRFKVDSDLTLVSMLDYPDLSLGLRTSAGDVFDLTGYTLVGGNIIQLDVNIEQPTYTADDVILGDWRSDLDREIVLERQPVRSISSVFIGNTETTNYTFYSDADPLNLGGSSQSNDRILITDTTLGGINTVTDEKHTLIGLYNDLLGNLGVDPFTVVVKFGALTYNGPFTANPDYTIEEVNSKVYVKRTADSQIADGGIVYISYSYVENITVTYTSNLVVNNAQLAIDETKHLIADVLVKETLEIPVNISAVVILNKGVSATTVDTLVRTATSNLINGLGLGARLRMSDIISVIDNQQGVSYVKVPLVEMSIASNSLILREAIPSEIITEEYIKIPELSTAQTAVWMLTTPLEFTSLDKGGAGGKVFKDKVEMTMLSTPSNPLNYKAGTCYILGTNGLTVIKNNQPYTYPNSAYRVLVGLKAGDDPSEHNFEVNYRVATSTGLVKDIVISDLAYFTVGTLSFTYEEDIK